MRFPIPISKFPPLNASEVTTSSGSEVPKATTVRPIRAGEIPNLEARLRAPPTVMSAPFRRRIRPIAKRRSGMIMGLHKSGIGLLCILWC
ncbi:MAG: hypothetical protein A4E42_01419 [Methanoregulaceae archaeon PtaU1.Bin222]|nr:MAG: hypothetical protein A4E42_01419 [Methanoregulaceae archaeon PtaU1.Bin222]